MNSSLKAVSLAVAKKIYIMWKRWSLWAGKIKLPTFLLLACFGQKAVIGTGLSYGGCIPPLRGFGHGKPCGHVLGQRRFGAPGQRADPPISCMAVTKLLLCALLHPFLKER